MFSGSRCCLRTSFQRRLLPVEIPRIQPFLAAQTTQQPICTKPSAHKSSETVHSITFEKSQQTPSGDYVPPSTELFHPHQDVPQPLYQDPSKALTNTLHNTQSASEAASKQTVQAIIDRRKATQGLVVRRLLSNGQYQRTYFPAPGSTSAAEPRPRLDRDKRSAILSSASWELTLDMLVNSDSQQKEAHGEEIWLHKQPLFDLTGSSEANSWIHHVRGGCEVYVTDTQCSSGASRQVYLRGSPRAVALTREYLTSIENGDEPYQEQVLRGESTVKPKHDIPKGDPDADPSPVPKLPMRAVHVASKSHIERRKWVHGEGIQPPEIYDVRSLKEYIEDLTAIRPPRLVARDIYEHQDVTHNIAVANIIRRLFSDAFTARFASSVAVHLAFMFLCKRTELFGCTNLLYEQCRNLGLTLLPQTYNSFLRMLLLRDETAIFDRVFGDLLSDGHMPDSEVWLALLEKGKSPSQRSTAFKWMHRKDLMGIPSVRRKVVAEIVRAELRAIKSGKANAGVFIKSMDSRLGQDWMSNFTVADALLACADNKAWPLTLELLKQALKRNVNLNPSVMPAVFIILQRRGSLLDSLNLVSSHVLRTVGRSDDVIIPIVFMTAWKRRSYNVCRVLWRYAAVQGAITYKMQNVVTNTLLRNQDIVTSKTAEANKSRSAQEWSRRAGKIIVGMDLEIDSCQQLFHMVGGQLNSLSRNPMTWLARFTIDGEQRDQQLSLAYVMIHRDLSAWKYFAPPCSERLIKLLSEAYEMDVRWKAERIGVDRDGKSTQWMIDNAIDVPLVRREILRVRFTSQPPDWAD